MGGRDGRTRCEGPAGPPGDSAPPPSLSLRPPPAPVSWVFSPASTSGLSHLKTCTLARALHAIHHPSWLPTCPRGLSPHCPAPQPRPRLQAATPSAALRESPPPVDPLSAPGHTDLSGSTATFRSHQYLNSTCRDLSLGPRLPQAGHSGGAGVGLTASFLTAWPAPFVRASGMVGFLFLSCHGSLCCNSPASVAPAHHLILPSNPSVSC